ncbi:MAG: alkaline phosphatase [Sphingomonadaceae bacterium]|nr:MAG: alkaline phosphatase [Sphingomonadaceae bacterium]
MIKSEPPRAALMPPLNRRAVLRAGALGAGLAAAPLAAHAGERGFAWGVASGEPGASSVLLWSRYVAAQPTMVEWEIRDDSRRLVGGGHVEASPDNDWCVKPVATGLEPGRWYTYRFHDSRGNSSAEGRTRTLPVGPTEQFRMAVFSCANLGFGWFNAYAHAAAADGFDLVVHTGDYFYEYEPGTYPSRSEAMPGRFLDPASETVSLADYRLRHANYRRDADLQRLTQLYPMIMGWDDHESANDSYATGAENHQPETEGEWSVRKRAAMRAYREWLPVSDADYAAYEIGDLATIFRLETRLGARDEPFSIGRVLKGQTSSEAAQQALRTFRNGAYFDPSRTMLGLEQESWLADGLRRSRAGGKTWQVLAQQVIMGSSKAPGSLIGALSDAVPQFVRERVLAAILASSAGIPTNMDAWDGYPAARQRLFQSSLEADANLLVLAGDSHNAWAFDLDHGGTPVGVEFAGQSVTSPGYEAYLGTVDQAGLARTLVEENPQLRWANTSQRGYLAVELTPARASAEFRFLDTVRQHSTKLAGTKAMVSQAGSRVLDAG